MNRTSALGIHTRVRLGFVTALVSLVAIGFISQRRLEQSMEDAVWVSHTEQVLDQIDGIAATLRTAESEERGFLLTGEQKLRENFRDAQQQTSTHLALLRMIHLWEEKPRPLVDMLVRIFLRRITRAECSDALRRGSSIVDLLLRS